MAATSPLRNVEMTGSVWLASIERRKSSFFESTPEAGRSRLRFLKPVELPMRLELLKPEELFIY